MYMHITHRHWRCVSLSPILAALCPNALVVPSPVALFLSSLSPSAHSRSALAALGAPAQVAPSLPVHPVPASHAPAAPASLAPGDSVLGVPVPVARAPFLSVSAAPEAAWRRKGKDEISRVLRAEKKQQLCFFM